MQQKVNNAKLHRYTVTHIHRFDSHFADEPGLAGCPLINKWCWSNFFYWWDALPLNQPTASKQWRINGHKFLQASEWLACHPTNSVNKLMLNFGRFKHYHFCSHTKSDPQPELGCVAF